MEPTRECQFVNGRLLLSWEKDAYGLVYYKLTDISNSALKIELRLSKQEFEEIVRIVEDDFKIPNVVDDDIPF